MLYLLGTGLYYLTDIPLNAVEAIKNCDSVFLERYTNTNDISSLGDIEKLTGKQIKVLDRSDVESEDLVALAKKSNVALLIPGDPLFATTHISLISSCAKNGVKYRVIHAGSILTAAAETGLSLYKFGGVCSIPIYSKGFEPESFFDTIEKNIREGFHSLVLLEAKNDTEFVDPVSAVKILKKIEKERAENIIDWNSVVCLVGMGSDKQHMFMVSSGENSDKPPVALIIPSSLSEVEKENLRTLVGNSD